MATPVLCPNCQNPNCPGVKIMLGPAQPVAIQCNNAPQPVDLNEICNSDGDFIGFVFGFSTTDGSGDSTLFFVDPSGAMIPEPTDWSPCGVTQAEVLTLLCDDTTNQFVGILVEGSDPPVTEYFIPQPDGSMVPYVPTGDIIECVPPDIEETEVCYVSNVDATDISVDDTLTLVRFWDTSLPAPPTLLASVWVNETTGNIVTTIDFAFADLSPCNNPIHLEHGCITRTVVTQGELVTSEVLTVTIPGTINFLASGTLASGCDGIDVIEESTFYNYVFALIGQDAEINIDSGGNIYTFNGLDLSLSTDPLATFEICNAISWAGAVSENFATVTYQYNIEEVEYISVQITKSIDADGLINSVRVFDTHSNIEVPLPLAATDVLSTGTCPTCDVRSERFCYAENVFLEFEFIWDNNTDTGRVNVLDFGQLGVQIANIDWGDGNLIQLASPQSSFTTVFAAGVFNITLELSDGKNEYTYNRILDTSDASFTEFDFDEQVFTYEAVELTDCNDNKTYLRFFDNEIIPRPTSFVECVSSSTASEELFSVQIAYLERCAFLSTSITSPNNTNFSDNTGTLTINPLSPENLIFLNDLFNDAIVVARNQDENGITVDPIVIIGGSGFTYEFSPLDISFNPATGIYTIATAAQWGTTQTVTTIDEILYTSRINCECIPIEVLQHFNSETGEAEFVALYSPILNSITLEKELLPLPLQLGDTNMQLGPCPAPLNVVDVRDLCCNDDLVVGSPDIVSERIAWLDATEIGLMLDDIAGTPIAGNDGDLVGEIQDKTDPGIAPSFLRETAGPQARPILRLDSVNGLPTLEFDGVDDRIGIDTGLTVGQPMNGFFLLGLPSGGTNAALVSVGDTGDRGTSYFTTAGSWQISRGAPSEGTNDNLVFRYQQAGNINVDTPIGLWTDFADGQVHLVTYNYDGTNVNIWIDGQQVLANFVPTEPLLSGYFRIFGNRGNTSFPAGNLAEYLITNNSLTEDDIGTVNGYLICKWSIDPSQVTSQPGVELQDGTTFTAQSDFILVTLANGQQRIQNKYTGQRFFFPPIAGLGFCSDNFESSAISEERVCADGLPAIKQIRIDGDGNEFVSFVGEDGAAVNPTNWVPGDCSVTSSNYQTVVQDADTAIVTIVPGTDLVSWTVRHRSNTVTIQVNGGAVLNLDLGETMSSGAVEEEGSVLDDTVVVDATAGIARVTTLRRV